MKQRRRKKKKMDNRDPRCKGERTEDCLFDRIKAEKEDVPILMIYIELAYFQKDRH